MFIDSNKERIADLEREKIGIKDQLEYTTSVSKVIKLEEALYEVEDSIKKLAHPIRPA
jgi:hypothetical protein